MLFDAATRGRLWPANPPVTGFAGELMRSLAGLFEVTTPLEREALVHRVALLVIVAVGCFVRFWGLGSVGLHGDEETMAMAAMHIVKDGVPTLPSGMFYPRGLTELYLMAFSVGIFGESEWAFRLPSALCGVALIVLTYLAGRRFLRPQWNLALAATVALLPEAIEYSQTARMYIFLLTSVAACLVCIFAWERSGRTRWLVGAVLTLTIGIELHALAVTSVLVFLLPGLLQGDMRKVLQGAVGAAVVMVAYVGISGWADAQYPVPPPEYAADLGPPLWDRAYASQEFDLTFDVALWVAGIGVAFFAFHLSRVIPPRPAAISVVVLLWAGLLAQLMLHYHVAGLLFIAATVVARRYGGPRIWRRLSIFAMGSGLLALIHFSLLIATPGSLLKVVGALVGQPSVWPYVRIMEFSRVAGLLAVIALFWGLWQLATRRRATDYWLLSLLGVWIPMFTIGLFVWSMPSRYTAASLVPMLLCAFAFAQYGVDSLQKRLAVSGWRLARKATSSSSEPTANRQPPTAFLHSSAAFIVAALAINPLAAAGAINPGYALYPDHLGAAEFMRQQNLQPEDVVLAEDVLQQTYYLGSVDYWLISRAHARRFVERVDGEIRDFYTGTPVISSARMLGDLLERERGRRVFIIGSGENQGDKRAGMRGDMAPIMNSDRFEVVYLGRDKETKVWRAVAPESSKQESSKQGSSKQDSKQASKARQDSKARGVASSPA